MEYPTLIQQRNLDLQAAYKRIIRCKDVNLNFLRRRALVELVASEPAPRFYITSYWAGVYIRAYYKGQTQRGKRKRQMIEDLVKVYERVRNENPNFTQDGLYELTVEQPAPSFYMSEHRMIEVIFNYTGRNGKK